MRKRRTVILRCRVSEEEAIAFNLQMTLSGFRNKSKYMRHCLFLDKRTRRRNFRRTDANLVKQMELLRSEIKRIGVNYNQTVRTLNTLSNMRDKRGNVIVSAHTVDGALSDMHSMMTSILNKMDAVSREVNDSEDKDSPDAGDDDNPSSTF